MYAQARKHLCSSDVQTPLHERILKLHCRYCSVTGGLNGGDAGAPLCHVRLVNGDGSLKRSNRSFFSYTFTRCSGAPQQICQPNEEEKRNIKGDVSFAAGCARRACMHRPALPGAQLCVRLGAPHPQQPLQQLVADKAYRVLRHHLERVGRPAAVEATQPLPPPDGRKGVGLRGGTAAAGSVVGWQGTETTSLCHQMLPAFPPPLPRPPTRRPHLSCIDVPLHLHAPPNGVERVARRGGNRPRRAAQKQVGQRVLPPAGAQRGQCVQRQRYLPGHASRVGFAQPPPAHA